MKRLLLCIALFSAFASADLPSAVAWLEQHQDANGSYGAYQEHMTAVAGWALRASGSAASNNPVAFTVSQLNSPQAWFYGEWGEADVPSAMLWSLASSNALSGVELQGVSQRILAFQVQGFKGYYDAGAGHSVESGVDTSLAFLGLVSAGMMPEQNKTAALAFLYSLQDADGSFKLTPTTGEDPLYSLGPDKQSGTAIALLAIKKAGAQGSQQAQNAIAYLKTRAQACYSNKAYAAAVSALAFAEYGEEDYASAAVNHLKTLQHADGGFADATRSPPQDSNALDTGFAVLAMRLPPTNEGACVPLASPVPTVTPTPSATPQAQNYYRNLDSQSVLEARLYQNSAEFYVTYSAPSQGFGGTLSIRLPFDYADYLNGAITISPRPDSVSPGSVVAGWDSLSLAPWQQFKISVYANRQFYSSTADAFTPPYAQNTAPPALPSVQPPSPTVVVEEKIVERKTPSCSVTVGPLGRSLPANSGVTVYYADFESTPSVSSVQCGNGLAAQAQCSGTDESGYCVAQCAFDAEGSYLVNAFVEGKACLPASAVAFQQTQAPPQAQTGLLAAEAGSVALGALVVALAALAFVVFKNR